MSADSKTALAGLTPDELAVEMESVNEKRYRSEQIVQWIYGGRADGFSAMTNLPVALRRALSDRFTVFSTQTEKKLDAFDGTKKYLLRLHDGNAIETVLIPEEARGNAPPQNTVCVSTQVGCPIKCRFCASGQGGFVRNLSSGEIVEQALRVRNDLPPEQRINRVVVMGIGEPLMNFDSLVEALSRLGAEWCLGIGANRVTVSTIGIIGKIQSLARIKRPPHLAISLHAPNDEVRNRVMGGRAPSFVGELIACAQDYARITWKDVTIEYVLISGLNAAREHAEELARRLHGTGLKVNLIPLNPVPQAGLGPPSSAETETFRRTLSDAGIRVLVRMRRGDDISAACGQLRAARPKQGNAL